MKEKKEGSEGLYTLGTTIAKKVEQSPEERRVEEEIERLRSEIRGLERRREEEKREYHAKVERLKKSYDEDVVIEDPPTVDVEKEQLPQSVSPDDHVMPAELPPGIDVSVPIAQPGEVAVVEEENRLRKRNQSHTLKERLAALLKEHQKKEEELEAQVEERQNQIQALEESLNKPALAEGGQEKPRQQMGDQQRLKQLEGEMRDQTDAELKKSIERQEDALMGALQDDIRKEKEFQKGRLEDDALRSREEKEKAERRYEEQRKAFEAVEGEELREEKERYELTRQRIKD